MRQTLPLRRGLLGAMLACAALSAAQATPQAFDALWHEIDRRDQVANRNEALVQELQTLRAQLPAGDAYRAAQLRYLECLSEPGNRKRAITLAQQWMEEAARANDLAAQVMAGTCRATLMEDATDDTWSYADELDRLLEQARQLGQPLWIGRLLETRGSARSIAGEQALALMDLLAANEQYTQAGLPDYASGNLFYIGVAYRRVGDHTNATEFIHRAMDEARRRAAWQTLIYSHLQLAYIHEDQGHTDQAEAEVQQALVLAQQHNEDTVVPSVQLAEAYIRLLRGQYSEALRMIDTAERALRVLGDHAEDSFIAHYRGAALAGLGRYSASLPLLDKAVADWSARRHTRYLSEALADRARVLEALGRFESALHDIKRLLELHQQLDTSIRDQQLMIVRERFAAAERQAENARLQAEQQVQAAQLDAAAQTRRWQGVALGISALLLAGLGWLLWRQHVLTRQLRTVAVTDSLTGVLNRRGIERLASQAIALAQRTHAPLCVLTFDIDHFKRVNDELGHASGDQVLARVAHIARAALRQYDQLGRIGGEEFLALLPGATLDDARPIGERLRQQVEAAVWDDLRPGLRITLSWGLTQLRDSDTGLADALHRADEALYEAKRSGRNRGITVT